MPNIEITHRFTGSVLFRGEYASIKTALEAAVKEGAYLEGANLEGATYGEGVPIGNTPIQLLGTKCFILIMDTHIKIGCKLFSHEQWAAFTDKEISRMDSGALEWWREWKGTVLSLSLGHQQRLAAKHATA
jgi:hypothetical protein